MALHGMVQPLYVETWGDFQTTTVLSFVFIFLWGSGIHLITL